MTTQDFVDRYSAYADQVLASLPADMPEEERINRALQALEEALAQDEKAIYAGGQQQLEAILAEAAAANAAATGAPQDLEAARATLASL